MYVIEVFGGCDYHYARYDAKSESRVPIFREALAEWRIVLMKSVYFAMVLQGFFRIYEDMPDIILDVPLAYTVLERFVEKCYKTGFVAEDVVKKMPVR